ncbi:penicillin-binding protein activator [Azospirillum halopraeferens]|uniref:penicillin-binding protein activator n=1 Tax=Azospirillum halopraeferens TaxID=34010 RepID=UPI00042996BC|nr:penicillin-binding protein activator [Azospirillum halopraeferens]
MAQPIKVALLLPLSGPGAAIGQPMLDAAQLALFERGGERFQLLPRDTGGTPRGAADAARAALAEGASLILGPLFAQEVAAVRPIAQASGVEVMAFTTDRTQSGPGTYVLGLVPGDQVVRVAGFTRSRGVTRFAVLAPRNAYGDAVTDALQDAARRFDARVVQVERYDPNLADLSVLAQQVAQSPAQPEAVLLAEGGQRVKDIAAALRAAGVTARPLQFLGTGLWDEPGMGSEPALVGAWYAAPETAPRAAFEASFRRAYGKEPPRLATLAYDATALAAVLTSMGGPQPFSRPVLTDPAGFGGVDGLFRLHPTGTVERGLAVLEVTAGGPRVVDPAPRTFEVLGQ